MSTEKEKTTIVYFLGKRGNFSQLDNRLWGLNPKEKTG